MSESSSKRDSGPPAARPPHWLVRRGTIRMLWVLFLAVLGALVAIDPLLGAGDHGPAAAGAGDGHGGPAVKSSFAFYAWFGFATCAAMVLFAKALGYAVKRPDEYYERADDAAA